jgi:hypothetical protein
MLGRNSHGAWVARARQGRCGGLFVDRSAAERFVRRETGEVLLMPGGLELEPQSSAPMKRIAER